MKKKIMIAPNIFIDFYSWGGNTNVGLVSRAEQLNDKLEDAFDSIQLSEDASTPESDYILKVMGKEAGRIVMPFEMVVKDGYYDSETSEMVIVLNIGSGEEKEIRFSVKDLIDEYVGDDITIKVEGNVISFTDSMMNKILKLDKDTDVLGIKLDTVQKMIPSLDGYAKEEWVESKGYITEHQDLSNYALKSEIPTKTSDLENDSNFISEHQSLDGYATEAWVESKGYLTEHQPLDGYALKSDIPTKTSQLENDSHFLTEHQDLSSYALKEEIPTKTSELINDSNFITEHQSLVGYATEQWVEDKHYLTEHQDLSNYATKDEIPSIDNLSEKGHTHTTSEVEGLDESLSTKTTLSDVKDILKDQLYRLFNIVLGDSSDFNTMDASDSSKAYAVLGNGETIAMTEAKTMLGSSVKLNNIDLETESTIKSALSIKAKEVSLENVELSGSWSKSVSGNAMISVNESENVVIKDSEVTRTGGYNVVEIGLKDGGTVKSVTIDGLNITADVSNNPINIFSFTDGANILIQNCHFTSVSNPIRISNTSFAENVTITIKDCTFDNWDTSASYAGLILFQECTSKTHDEIVEKKPFSTFNLVIDNVTGPNGLIENPTSMDEICGCGIADKQIVYMYGDHYSSSNGGALIPYSEEMYPTITIK